MLATISAMDTTLAGIFLVAAVICWVLAAFGVVVSRINLIALGLALFGVPFFINAFAGVVTS